MNVLNIIKKNKLVTFLLFIIILLIIGIGITYSYLAVKVNNLESTSTIIADSGKMTVIYNDPEHPEYGYSDTIILEKIAPGAYAEKIFTITGQNNLSDENSDNLVFYKIGIVIDDNTFSEGAIKYQLTRLSETDETSEMAQNSGEQSVATSGIQWIGNGYFGRTEETVHKYNLRISFPDNGEDQSEDMEKTFAAHINVSGTNEFATLVMDIDPLDSSKRKTVKIQKEAEIELEEPTRVGFTFAGWERVSGDVTVVDNKIYANSDRVEVRAKWVAIPINVLLKLSGGTSTDGYNFQMDSFSTKELAIPKKQGFIFTEWTVTGGDATVAGNKVTVQNTDIELTANWEVGTMVLAINTNGGTTTQDTGVIINQFSIFTLVNPTRNGYTFAGWEVVSGDGTVTGNLFQSKEENTEVKAKWNPETYTITYTLNGGSLTGQKTTYTPDDANYTLPIPTYTNYKFDGWYTESTFNNRVTSLSTGSYGDKTYYAKWLTVIPIFTYSGEYTTINDGGDNWRIKFLTGGTLTFSDLGTGASGIDVFLVGGGGGGGGGDTSTTSDRHGGAGGGGGYTKTVQYNSLQLNTNYSIVVGQGGSGGGYGSNGNQGGESSAFGYKAAGGYGGTYNGTGGKGGSGGGRTNNPSGGNGGTNGGNGDAGKGQIEVPGPNGETGNTREFKESTGYIYSGGGGGGRSAYNSGGSMGKGGANGGGDGGTAGKVNTGGGGGGGQNWSGGFAGGSGIVIIRNHR